jgi:hypothetical protein
MVLETLVYSPLSSLMWLLDREYFIQFSRRESFKLYVLIVQTSSILNFSEDKSNEVPEVIQ